MFRYWEAMTRCCPHCQTDHGILTGLWIIFTYVIWIKDSKIYIFVFFWTTAKVLVAVYSGSALGGVCVWGGGHTQLYWFMVFNATSNNISVIIIAVLCKTCSLLYVLEQPRVDNASAGPIGSNWPNWLKDGLVCNYRYISIIQEHLKSLSHANVIAWYLLSSRYKYAFSCILKSNTLCVPKYNYYAYWCYSRHTLMSELVVVV